MGLDWPVPLWTAGKDNLSRTRARLCEIALNSPMQSFPLVSGPATKRRERGKSEVNTTFEAEATLRQRLLPLSDEISAAILEAMNFFAHGIRSYPIPSQLASSQTEALLSTSWPQTQAMK